jgi:hypothetical protein
MAIMDAITRISAAQSIFERDRKHGFAALNEIFRAGSSPNPPLDGGYAGELVALDMAPGLNQFVEMITSRWLPWKGKFFNAAHASGDNILPVTHCCSRISSGRSIAVTRMRAPRNIVRLRFEPALRPASLIQIARF